METSFYYRKVQYRLVKYVGALHTWKYRMHYGNRLLLGDNIECRRQPIIEIAPGASINIGNNVTLNSYSRNYHVHLHSPVKLVADRQGAVIEIGDNTRIHGSCLHAWEKITIGKNCLIAANCNIIDSSGHELSFASTEMRLRTQDTPRPVTVGDNVWIGTNVLVLPDTSIGKGSVIGAGSIVRGEIPPYSLVSGNPATIIKQFPPEKT